MIDVEDKLPGCWGNASAVGIAAFDPAWPPPRGEEIRAWGCGGPPVWQEQAPDILIAVLGCQRRMTGTAQPS